VNVIVVSSSAPLGKGESFVVSEVNALAAKGVRVTLVPTVLRKGNSNRFCFHNGVKILSYPLFSFSAACGVMRLAFLNFRVLSHLIKISASSGLVNVLKNLVVIPKSILIADYARKNNIQHIHAHWLTASSTLAMMASVQTGIPWSVTAHRGDIVSSNALRQKFDNASFVRFISRSGLALARARCRLDGGKFVILHMGVQLPFDNLSRVDRSQSAVMTILCPANLLPVKGHSVLLRALSILKTQKPVRVELAGDGKLRQHLERLAQEVGVADKVVFRGHVPHGELIDAYRKSKVDIVVLPSLDLGNGVHEGIPVSLMEAMAWGVPVVSTRTGGIPELLVNDLGENVGVLVNPGDVWALAEALSRLVESPDLRVELGALGRERVASDFNQELAATELVGLMKGVTSSDCS